MKNLFLFFAFISLGVTTMMGQQVNLATNTANWTFSTTGQAGSFTNVPFNVGMCANDCIIRCLCPNQPLLNLGAAGDNCAGTGAQAIWGIPPPPNCTYPGATYWFQRNFNLTLNQCSVVQNAIINIRGDNEYTLSVNGQQVGQTVANWQAQPQAFNIAPFLVNGQNNVVVRVQNYNTGGECINYGFLYACGNVTTGTPPIQQAWTDFNASMTSNGPTSFSVTATPVLFPGGVTHTWTIFGGATPATTTTQIGNVITSNTLGPITLNCSQGPIFRIRHTVIFCGQRLSRDRIVTNCPTVKPMNEYAAEASASAANNTNLGLGDMLIKDNEKAETNDESFIISPNPTQDKININLKSTLGKEGTLSIYNTEGKLMANEVLENLDVNKEINCQTWVSGLYIVELKSDKDTYIQKVIVRH